MPCRLKQIITNTRSKITGTKYSKMDQVKFVEDSLN